MSARHAIWFNGRPVYGETGEKLWAYEDGEWKTCVVAPPGLRRKWVPILFAVDGWFIRNSRRLLTDLRPRNPLKNDRPEGPPA